MKTLCIIPARGGSKRIPRKNIRPFAGKPMIAWSIEAALASDLFDRVIVSTDDPEVGNEATRYGAEVPFVRPPDLSGDHTPLVPVVRHAAREAGATSETLVCCLFATAPFVTPELLREGLDALRTNPGTDFVFSAARFSFPIFRAVGQQADGTVRLFQPQHALTRSQDLPAAFHEAGQFWWATPEALERHDSIYAARCRMVVVPAERVQDIDTEEDWARAEIIARYLNLEEGVRAGA